MPIWHCLRGWKLPQMLFLNPVCRDWWDGKRGPYCLYLQASWNQKLCPSQALTAAFRISTGNKKIPQPRLQMHVTLVARTAYHDIRHAPADLDSGYRSSTRANTTLHDSANWRLPGNTTHTRAPTRRGPSTGCTSFHIRNGRRPRRRATCSRATQELQKKTSRVMSLLATRNNFPKFIFS